MFWIIGFYLVVAAITAYELYHAPIMPDDDDEEINNSVENKKIMKEELKNEHFRHGQLEGGDANDVLRRCAAMPKQESLSDFLPDVWMTGNVTVLHANTGLGKSILAVQLAEEAACKGHTVIYCDFEMDDTIFYERYSDARTGEIADLHFLRLTRNTQGLGSASTTMSELLSDIADAMEHYDADVLVVDSMNFICSRVKEREVSSLMSKLVTLSKSMGWSLMLVASNSLPEGQTLANLCDAAFAIGATRKSSEVYIKQTKSRYGHTDDDTVKVCRIVKEGAMTCFSHIRYIDEAKLIYRIVVR